MHPQIIFDDGRGQFGPITDLRASFEIRTGALTTGARIAAHRPRTLAGYWVPSHLEPVISERANAPVNRLPDEETILCVNGRWGLPNPDLSVGLGHAIREAETGDVVVACLRRADAEYFLSTGELHERVRDTTLTTRQLIRHPWDILDVAPDAIRRDIDETRILDAQVPGDLADIIGTHPVEIHEGAVVYPGVVLDADEGPIQIHDDVTIRPGAVICGPCSLGPHTTVLDHAVIRPNCAFGPWCKVAGEVSGVIMQGFSNKAHDGFLGDSWVGKWVNLGAGTTNSNLLNTYGEVTMRLEPSGPRQRTGRTFLGAVIGDHAKFAINTRLMTGSVIGTGAMIATTAAPPTTVRRFGWLTDDGERVYAIEKFVKTMETVMARRSRTPGPRYVEAVRALHRTAIDGGE